MCRQINDPCLSSDHAGQPLAPCRSTHALEMRRHANVPPLFFTELPAEITASG